MAIRIEQVKTQEGLMMVFCHEQYIGTVVKPDTLGSHAHWLLCWHDGKIERCDSLQATRDLLIAGC